MSDSADYPNMFPTAQRGSQIKQIPAIVSNTTEGVQDYLENKKFWGPKPEKKKSDNPESKIFPNVPQATTAKDITKEVGVSPDMYAEIKPEENRDTPGTLEPEIKQDQPPEAGAISAIPGSTDAKPSNIKPSEDTLRISGDNRTNTPVTPHTDANVERTPSKNSKEGSINGSRGSWDNGWGKGIADAIGIGLNVNADVLQGAYGAYSSLIDLANTVMDGRPLSIGSQALTTTMEVMGSLQDTLSNISGHLGDYHDARELEKGRATQRQILKAYNEAIQDVVGFSRKDVDFSQLTSEQTAQIYDKMMEKMGDDFGRDIDSMRQKKMMGEFNPTPSDIMILKTHKNITNQLYKVRQDAQKRENRSYADAQRQLKELQKRYNDQYTARYILSNDRANEFTDPKILQKIADELTLQKQQYQQYGKTFPYENALNDVTATLNGYNTLKNNVKPKKPPIDIIADYRKDRDALYSRNDLRRLQEELLNRQSQGRWEQEDQDDLDRINGIIQAYEDALRNNKYADKDRLIQDYLSTINNGGTPSWGDAVEVAKHLKEKRKLGVISNEESKILRDIFAREARANLSDRQIKTQMAIAKERQNEADYVSGKLMDFDSQMDVRRTLHEREDSGDTLTAEEQTALKNLDDLYIIHNQTLSRKKYSDAERIDQYMADPRGYSTDYDALMDIRQALKRKDGTVGLNDAENAEKAKLDALFTKYSQRETMENELRKPGMLVRLKNRYIKDMGGGLGDDFAVFNMIKGVTSNFGNADDAHVYRMVSNILSSAGTSAEALRFAGLMDVASQMDDIKGQIPPEYFKVAGRITKAMAIYGINPKYGSDIVGKDMDDRLKEFVDKYGSQAMRDALNLAANKSKDVHAKNEAAVNEIRALAEEIRASNKLMEARNGILESILAKIPDEMVLSNGTEAIGDELMHKLEVINANPTPESISSLADDPVMETVKAYLEKNNMQNTDIIALLTDIARTLSEIKGAQAGYAEAMDDEGAYGNGGTGRGGESGDDEGISEEEARNNLELTIEDILNPGAFDATKRKKGRKKGQIVIPEDEETQNPGDGGTPEQIIVEDEVNPPENPTKTPKKQPKGRKKAV